MLKRFTIVLSVASLLFCTIPATQAARASDTWGIVGTVLGGAALGLYAMDSLGYGVGRRGGYGGYGYDGGCGGYACGYTPVVYQPQPVAYCGGYGCGGYGGYGYGGGYGGGYGYRGYGGYGGYGGGYTYYGW